MDKENENIKGIEEEVSKKVEEIQINSADDNVNYDDDEDNLDYETMRKEANEHGLDIEIYEGEDPYGIIDEEDDELYDEKVKESLEEESFKNDEDFKKMLDRKKLIGISAFPQFEAEGEIYSVDIDEKKEVAILGDGEEMFYTVSLADFTCISKEKLHKDSIISAKYSADKSYFITASMDGVVKIFDATTMKCIHTIEDNSEEIMWTDWHPKGNVFAFGTNDGVSYLYNAKNGESVMSLYGHLAACSAGSFSPDGKTLVTASSDKTLKIWELKNQKCTYTIKGHRFHKADILCMSLAKKKTLAATGSAFNEVGITNYETGSIVHFFDSGNDNFSIENIVFSNDDNFVVFSSTDHLIRILELQKLTIRTKIALGEENITKMVPSSVYPTVIYLGTSFGRFLVFDSKGNGEFKHSEQLHCTGLMDFALTKAETFVLTSSLDRTINFMRLDAELLELKVTSLFN